MSDRPPTADQQDAGSRDSRSLSVAEAAQRLGITPDAVRGRLHCGTLYGEKVGTEWRVFLPDVEAPTADRQATQQPPTAAQQDTTADQQAATVERQATDRTGDWALAEVIADLARRNEELAAAAAMWQSRAAHLEERLLALGAGQDAPVAAREPQCEAEPAEASHDSSLSWWTSWWRRLTGGTG